MPNTDSSSAKLRATDHTEEIEPEEWHTYFVYAVLNYCRVSVHGFNTCINLSQKINIGNIKDALEVISDLLMSLALRSSNDLHLSDSLLTTLKEEPENVSITIVSFQPLEQV